MILSAPSRPAQAAAHRRRRGYHRCLCAVMSSRFSPRRLLVECCRKGQYDRSQSEYKQISADGKVPSRSGPRRLLLAAVAIAC